MKVLAIKQPWAQMIATGIKTVEVRSKPSNIRERVAIYASRTPDNELGKGIVRPGMPKGYIIATVEIVGCKQYIQGTDFLEDDVNHMIPCANLSIHEFVGFYGWKLANVKRLETPMPYKMPKGCVVWASVELDL